MIHDLACLAQLQIDHPGAESAMSLGQGDDPLLERAIKVCSGLVTQCTGAHDDHAQRATFTQSVADHVVHQFAFGRCAYHFFLKASFVTSFSSIASANSRLSRPFSDSSSLRRLTSDTFMPPNLLRKGNSWPPRSRACGTTRLPPSLLRLHAESQ